MELRHLHIFQTIIDEGSFVRAAEKLNYSQATITLKIQQLEEDLGVALFQRENKRRLQLTEAGKLLLTQLHSCEAARLTGSRSSLDSLTYTLQIWMG